MYIYRDFKSQNRSSRNYLMKRKKYIKYDTSLVFTGRQPFTRTKNKDKSSVIRSHDFTFIVFITPLCKNFRETSFWGKIFIVES